MTWPASGDGSGYRLLLGRERIPIVQRPGRRLWHHSRSLSWVSRTSLGRRHQPRYPGFDAIPDRGIIGRELDPMSRSGFHDPEVDDLQQGGHLGHFVQADEHPEYLTTRDDATDRSPRRELCHQPHPTAPA